MMNSQNSYLLVDKGLIRSNIRQILSELEKNGKNADLIPVLKDDAYGLGLEQIANVIAEFKEISCIACAHISEGLRLRKAGIKKEILILGNPAVHLISAALNANLTLTLARNGILNDISAAAKTVDIKHIQVNIEIDSGLHRTGFSPGTELDSLISSLKSNNGIEISVNGIYSHFSDPNNKERCTEEYSVFRNGILQLADSGIRANSYHISSSASFEKFPDYSMDAVRIGRRLYMDAPGITNGKIKEIASWRAYITGIYHRKRGDSVGYGRKDVLSRDSDLAVIGIGYGDGLDTALVSCHAPVLAGGKHAQLMVCFMDQAIVDITECDVSIGDEVTLFGYDGIGNYLSSQELALMIGDAEGCGLYSEISPRVERKYLN